MMSLQILKSSQRIPGSKFLISRSVFLCEWQWLPGPSRLSSFASHLGKDEPCSFKNQGEYNILWTPTINHPSKPNLLCVVSNVRAKAKYHMTEMSIWTFNNFVFLNVHLEGLKHNLQTLVVELAAEPLKFRSLALALAGWRVNQY